MPATNGTQKSACTERSITVKLPSRLHDEFGKLAARHGLSKTVYARKLIETSLKIWGRSET